MLPTRIAILDHTAQLGGAEIALLRLLEALPEDWVATVTLFAEGPLATSLADLGINVEVLPLATGTATQGRGGLTDPRVLLSSTWDSLGFTRRLAKRLREQRVELVIANSLKAAVLGSVAARVAQLPWVWHLHDRLSRDYLPQPVVVAMRALARTARHVVANSVQTAALTGLPSDRVSVAYPGLPASVFTQVHHDPMPPVLGLLGRISSTKGQREFIEAAALLSVSHPDAEFHIVGEALFNDRPYADHVRALPIHLGIGDRVRFIGWVDEPAVALDQFTALVHASPTPEPFGQVIVEAMARRVPVIATLGGGVGEILTGSATPPKIVPGCALATSFGQLVRPSDPVGLATAMAWVLDEPAAAADLALAAGESAQVRFTSEATAVLCTAAWRKALS